MSCRKRACLFEISRSHDIGPNSPLSNALWDADELHALIPPGHTKQCSADVNGYILFKILI